MELGRSDICVIVSMMSSHLELLWRGNLDEVLHIFVYLKGHANSEIVNDPRRIECYSSEFPRKDWSYSIYTHDGCDLS